MRILARFFSLIVLMIAFASAQNIQSPQNATNSQDTQMQSSPNSQRTYNAGQMQLSQNASNSQAFQATQGIDSKDVEAFYIQKAKKAPRTPCKRKFCPQDKEELKALVRNKRVHLGDIDTSAVSDMSDLFYDEVGAGKKAVEIRTNYEGIESWDTSNVVNMSRMFAYASSFNEPIGRWNVASVLTMREMFLHALRFNQPLNSWNVAGVEDMRGMFCYAIAFNQPLDKWNVRYVAQMGTMFEGAKSFNQPLDKWQVPSARDIGADMFVASPLEFNPPKWYKERMR